MSRNLRRIRAAVPRPTRRLSITVPVTVRAQAADGGPRRFRMELYTGEPLNLYGFDLPVVIDCATLDMTTQRLPALLDHMDYADCVVGQVERLAVGANGLPPLVAEGIFTPTADPRDAARFVLAKADAGFIWQASIGADPGRLDRIEAGQTVAVNGRTYPGPIYVSRDTVPREASFVVLGADRRTSAVLARRLKGGASMDDAFNAWLLALGFDDPSALNPVQMANLQLLYQDEQAEGDAPTADADADTTTDPAATADDTTTPTPQDTVPGAQADDTTTTNPDDPPPPTNAAARRPAVRGTGRPDPVADENRRVAANRSRISAIDRISQDAGNPEITVTAGGRTQTVNLAAHAIANNWTAQRTELEALRVRRGTGPAVMHRGQDRTAEALTCALLLRAGVRLDHPAFQTPQAVRLIPGFLRQNINAEARQRAMEAGHRYAGMSAVDICREALRIDGHDAPIDREEMIRAAIGSRPRIRAAGSSGGSLTNIFTTSVNAVLLTTYMEATDTTAGWVREADVADFKTNERPRMTKGPNLVKLPRGGEADHATRSDVGESYKIARYSRQFFMDEQDFIDDSLGALTDMPTEFGLAAARLRPDLVYAILLANPTLTATSLALCSTNAAQGNKLTTAALAAAKLKAAAAAMRLFRENSVNLNLMPSHLIVPPTLEFTAYELVNSTENIIAGTAGSVTERGNINTLQRLGLTVVADARLENGVTDPDSGTAYSGSSSTWWLASAMAHTIEVGYLRGTGRAPRVRSWVADKEGRYGMGWDVNMDIGAKAMDWKGFVRNEA